MPISASTHIEAAIAVGGAVLWLALIGALHVIKPELRPSVRMLSEYACRPRGWIMQLAFACVAISCFALVLATWSHIGHFGLILLTIAGVGFAGAGVFVTDQQSERPVAPTRSGLLHIVFSFIVIPIFPVAATIIGIDMSSNAIWHTVAAWLPVFYLLTWIGFIGFLGCSVVYSARRKVAPVGYYQRFMIVTYAAWLIACAGALLW